MHEEIAERFWSKVNKTDSCWLWTGTPSQTYGSITIKSKILKAHKVSFEMAFYPVAPGRIVCHKCDTPRCVRPDHLFIGDYKDNSQDMISKGRGFFNRPESHNLSPKGEEHWCHLLKDAQKGERNHHAILTEQQVSEIREKYASGDISQTKLAQEYNVAQTTISAIIRKVLWSYF
jgi:HNH endonuclease